MFRFRRKGTCSRPKTLAIMRAAGRPAQEHDLVVARDLLEGALEIVARVLVVAREPFLVGAHDARRRAEQPLAIGVVARPADERAHGTFSLGERGAIGRLASRRGRLGVALPG